MLAHSFEVAQVESAHARSAQDRSSHSVDAVAIELTNNELRKQPHDDGDRDGDVDDTTSAVDDNELASDSDMSYAWWHVRTRYFAVHVLVRVLPLCVFAALPTRTRRALIQAPSTRALVFLFDADNV
jgi:hypothetical protein